MSVERVRNSNQFSQKNNKPNLPISKKINKRNLQAKPSLPAPHSFPSLPPLAALISLPLSLLSAHSFPSLLPRSITSPSPPPLRLPASSTGTSSRLYPNIHKGSAGLHNDLLSRLHTLRHPLPHRFPTLGLIYFFLSLSPLVIYHLFLSAFGIFPLHHSLLVSHFPPCLSSPSSLPSFWVFLQFL